MKRTVLLLLILFSGIKLSAQSKMIDRMEAYFTQKLINHIEKFVKKKPDDPYVYMLLGDLYEEMYQYKKAAAAFDKCLSLYEQNPSSVGKYNPYRFPQMDDYEDVSINPGRVRESRISALFLAQQYDQCLRACDDLLKKDPGNETALRNRAHSLLYTGAYRAAVEAFQRISLSKDDTDRDFGLAKAYRNLRMTDSSLFLFNKIVSANPKSAVYIRERALLLSVNGDHKTALEDIERAFALAPDDNYTHYYRARVYFDIGEYGKAIADYRIIYNKYKTPGAKFSIGYAYLYQKDLKNARRVFDELVDDHPDYANGLLGRIHVNSYSGDLKNVQKDLDLAMRKFPEDDYFQLLTVLTYLKGNDFVTAKTLYEKLTKQFPAGYLSKPGFSYLDKYIRACTMYLIKSDYENGLHLLQEARQEYEEPANTLQTSLYFFPDILAKTGWVYDQIGNYREALVYYEKAAVFNPNAQDIKDLINQARQKQADEIKNDRVAPLLQILTPDTLKGNGRLLVLNEQKQLTLTGLCKDISGIKWIKVNGVQVTDIQPDGFFRVVMSNIIQDITIQVTDAGNHVNSKTFTTVLPVDKKRQIAKNGINLLPQRKPVFHALIILNSDYPAKPLPAVRPEGREFKDVLIRRYGFRKENIDTVVNGTKEAILRKLSAKMESMRPDDNLVIYYGGHGTYRKNGEDIRGYWIPVNAVSDSGYISSTEISTLAKRNNASHLLIISDACYGAAMARNDQVPFNDYEIDSKQLLVSCSWQEAPATSIFNKKVISALARNQQKFFSAHDLLVSIYNDVQTEAKTSPRIYTIEGDKGGEFIFFKQ